MTDAEILAAALEILRRADKPAKSLTLSQLYALYEPYRSKIGGWRGVKIRFRYLLEPVYAEGLPPLGQREVMSLKVLDWSDWRAWRARTEYAPGKLPADHTINLHLESLKAMLNWAVSEGRIPHNPLANAKRIGKRSRREVAPTEEEIAMLLAEANDAEHYIVLASNDAGMRRNELRLCRHEWVDHERGAIKLAASVCKGNKARTVPATKRLLDAISSLPRHFRSPYILHNPDTGEPWSYDTVGKWFERLKHKVGLPHIVLHDGRHHFASAGAERGIPVPVIQKQMGHSNIATTMTYIQTRDSATHGPALAAFEAGIVAELKKAREDNQGSEKSKR